MFDLKIKNLKGGESNMSGIIVPENCHKIQEVENTEKGKQGIFFSKHIADDVYEDVIYISLFACYSLSICSDKEVSKCKALQQVATENNAFVRTLIKMIKKKNLKRG